jgi:hypothetical protein
MTEVGVHYSGYASTGAGEIDLATVGDIGGGAGTNMWARLFIDQGDAGKMSVEFGGDGLGNGANWRITVRGYARMDAGDFISIEEPP